MCAFYSSLCSVKYPKVLGVTLSWMDHETKGQLTQICKKSPTSAPVQEQNNRTGDTERLHQCVCTNFLHVSVVVLHVFVVVLSLSVVMKHVSVSAILQVLQLNSSVHLMLEMKINSLTH